MPQTINNSSNTKFHDETSFNELNEKISNLTGATESGLVSAISQISAVQKRIEDTLNTLSLVTTNNHVEKDIRDKKCAVVHPVEHSVEDKNDLEVENKDTIDNESVSLQSTTPEPTDSKKKRKKKPKKKQSD